jgi:DNA-binding GntR family transcriptional regulator
VHVDENSPLPYWEQLANILRERIRTGEIQHRVPSLNTLTQEFGLSRNTVIKAISALEADGLVVARQGRGTFVTRR